MNEITAKIKQEVDYLWEANHQGCQDDFHSKEDYEAYYAAKQAGLVNILKPGKGCSKHLPGDYEQTVAE